jgi:curli biogenesis system outer membrane secretion channel CsgG
MKCNYLLLIFALLFISACSRSPAYKRESGQSKRPQTAAERQNVIEKAQKFSAPKKRAVVLAFWNDTPVKGTFEASARNVIKNILLEQGRVNVVDERDVPYRSEDFYLGADKINLPHILDNGKKWGVSLVIVGRISRIVFRRKDEDVGLLRPSQSIAVVDLEMRLIDVAGGKEVAIGQGAGSSEASSMNLFGLDREDTDEYRNEIVKSAIADAVNKGLPSLNREIDRIQWRGKIAKVTGNKIYINAGRATGLAPGDILKVASQGQDVFDPDTGLYLGRSQGELKGTLEVADFFGEDGSIVKVHSGGNFQEGDIVQLY